MNNEEAAQEIKTTMELFAEFLSAAPERVRHLTVVDSMGDAHFKVDLLNGQTIEGDGPLFQPGRGPAAQLIPLLQQP